MNLTPFIKIQANGEVLLAIKAQPRASKNAIGDVIGNELKIKITAPPVDSAANNALIDFLAEKLDCPKGAIRIVRGETTRHKTISVSGVDLAMILERLLE